MFSALPGLPALHRRLIRKLAPGPITFWIEAGGAELLAASTSLGVRAGVFTNESLAAVRVPSDVMAGEILTRTIVPVVAEAIPQAAGGPPAVDARAAREALSAAGVEVRAFAGTEATTLRRPSAVVRLTRSSGPTPISGWALVEPGPYDEAFVRRAAERTMLFVCTGNTCRSPMAEAIARSVGRAIGAGVESQSAGVGALAGAGVSPEAVKAVRGLGLDPPAGRARPLSAGIIASADEIYVMTRAHQRAVLSLDPSAASKTRLLDPAGRDVPDPIGSPQERYDEVARALRTMIERRLQEDPA